MSPGGWNRCIMTPSFFQQASSSSRQPPVLRLGPVGLGAYFRPPLRPTGSGAGSPGLPQPQAAQQQAIQQQQQWRTPGAKAPGAGHRRSGSGLPGGPDALQGLIDLVRGRTPSCCESTSGRLMMLSRRAARLFAASVPAAACSCAGHPASMHPLPCGQARNSAEVTGTQVF